jgi:hypothetical protein
MTKAARIKLCVSNETAVEQVRRAPGECLADSSSACSNMMGSSVQGMDTERKRIVPGIFFLEREL